MDLANYVLFSSLVVIAWAAVEIFLLLSIINDIREWLSFLDEESRENQEDIDNIYKVMAERDKRAR